MTTFGFWLYIATVVCSLALAMIGFYSQLHREYDKAAAYYALAVWVRTPFSELANA